MNYSKLFSKGKIGNVEIPNRTVMPPMDIIMSEKGIYDERVIKFYETRAKGGVGLIMTTANAVDDEFAGLIEPNQIRVFAPGYKESLKKMVDTIHKYETKIVIQFLHPGRQGISAINYDQQIVAPSAIKGEPYLEMPRALTTSEVKKLIGKFVSAAKTAYECGADGVELHAAHGYLLEQFMNPYANVRTDEYGGSFENRMRFITEIINGIKEFKPDNAFLSARINGSDFRDRGITIEDGVQIAKYLENAGLDSINVSTGTYGTLFNIVEPSSFPEGYRSWVKQITDSVNIPIIAVNHVKRPVTAEKLLEEGVSDFVALGRPLIADPEFVNKAKMGQEDMIKGCIGCLNCLDDNTGIYANCAINPVSGQEFLYNEDTIVKSGVGKTLAVVGGGPGGMMAALTAAAKGFKVVLFERKDTLGGSMILASRSVGKEKMKWSVDGIVNNIKACDSIEVRLNTEATEENLKAVNPDVVIVAIGGNEIVPPIPGTDSEYVVTAHDVLRDTQAIKNQKVAVVGAGLTGLETAEVMADQGNEVAVYDMLDQVAPGENTVNVYGITSILGEKNVPINLKHKLEEIKNGEVVFEDLASGNKVSEKVDVVVLSLGVRPNDALLKSLEGKFDKVIAVGDCSAVGKVKNATHAAFQSVWAL